MNVLHISPNFNYTCGVSKYLTLILPELYEQSHINLFFITNGGDSLKRLENIGIQPIIINFKTGFKNLFYLRKNLKELKNFCIKNKIEIIHTHHRYPEFLVNHLKRELNIKTVTTVHSLVKSFKKFSFNSDRIIAVSKAVESNLIHYFNVNPERVIQLYNPVDFNIKQIKDESNLNIPSNYRIILFIGRNDKVKGLDILLKAFENVSKTYSNIALIIVSDLTKEQREKIEKGNNKIFIFQPMEDVYEFYKNSEIVILPSHVESFPYVMLEAGIYKKLFIGSNVGGIKEFIEDEKNGLLFESENVDSLIERIIFALNLDLATKSNITENLHNKVLSLDNPQTYTQKLVNIYRQLLSNE